MEEFIQKAKGGGEELVAGGLETRGVRLGIFRQNVFPKRGGIAGNGNAGLLARRCAVRPQMGIYRKRFGGFGGERGFLLNRRVLGLAQKDFKALFQGVHAGNHADGINGGFGVERRQGEVALGVEGAKEFFLKGVLRDEQINLHGTGLAHAVGASDALLQHRGVPREIHVDDGVGGLKVEADGTRVAGEKNGAFRVVLKTVNERLAFVCGNGTVEPDETGFVFFKKRLDEVEHGGPFGEKDDFAVGFGQEFSEEFVKRLEFGGLARGLFVHENRGVGREPTHEQGLAQPQEVHLVEVGFVDDEGDDFEVAVVNLKLFLGGDDAEDFDAARGELLNDRGAGAAQEDGRKGAAELIEVFVAEDVPFFVGDAVGVEEAERGAEAAVVNEGSDGVEFLETVFERGAGEREGEAAFEALDDAGRGGFPVLDTLGLVEDDEVPRGGANSREVAEDLLVVGDGEKSGAVLRGALLRGALNNLNRTACKTLDFRVPLGFEAGGANNKDTLDAGLEREEFRHAHALDGFAQPHVVGQNGAAGANGKRDAVELVRKEPGFEERLAKRMVRGIAADFGDALGDVFAEEEDVHVLLGVGENGVGDLKLVEFLENVDQAADVGDGFAAQGGEDFCDGRGQVFRDIHAQRKGVVPVREPHLDAIRFPRRGAFCGGFAFGLFDHAHDVLARAEGVFAEVGTGAKRLPAFPTAQRNAIRAARGGIGNIVFGPNGF